MGCLRRQDEQGYQQYEKIKINLEFSQIILIFATRNKQRNIMSKKTSELRSELVRKIWDFLKAREITTLNVADLGDVYGPIAAYDPSTLSDHFYLDTLEMDAEFGTITVTASNDNSHDEWEINDLALECIENIAEWLEENKKDIEKFCVTEEDEELTDKDSETIDTIKSLFGKLSSYGKVCVMSWLYYEMYDSEKDEFLRETDNA